MTGEEYQSAYTGKEIDERLGKVPGLETSVSQLSAENNNQQKVLDTAVLFMEQALTEAQKAQARANIGATAGEDVEFADSLEWLEENGDTSKKYVLPDGYIYTYSSKTVTVEHNANDGTGFINVRPTASTGSNKDANTTRNGLFTTAPIAVDKNWSDCLLTISGLEKLVPTFYASLYVYYFDDAGTFIAYDSNNMLYAPGAGSSLTPGGAETEILLPVTIDLARGNTNGVVRLKSSAYIRVTVGVALSTAITDEDVQNLVINVDQLNTEETVSGWYSTGQQHSNDKATQQNSADIAALKERTAILETEVDELWETVENGDLVNIQTGEVLYAVGDSITYGTNVGGNSGSWVKHVIDINGYNAARSKNLGVSGIGFCTTASSKTVRTVVDENDFAAADIVTVAIGVNDWKNYNATLEDFFAEMEYCLTKIRGDNPYCRIFYILPFNWKPIASSFDTFYALGYKNDNNAARPYGNTLQAFVNMIKAKFEEDALKALDIHVIDMTKTPAITRYNIDTALSDGLHPTAECHEALAKEIARRIALA